MPIYDKQVKVYSVVRCPLCDKTSLVLRNKPVRDFVFRCRLCGKNRKVKRKNKRDLCVHIVKEFSNEVDARSFILQYKEAVHKNDEWSDFVNYKYKR